MIGIIWRVSAVSSVSAGLVDADDSGSFVRHHWLELNVHRLRLVDTMWPNCGIHFQIETSSWALREIILTCRRPLPSNVLRIGSLVLHVLGKTLQSNRCRCRDFCPKFEPNLNEKREFTIAAHVFVEFTDRCKFVFHLSMANSPFIIRGSRFFITSLAFSAYLRYSWSLALNAASNWLHLPCNRLISTCNTAKYDDWIQKLQYNCRMSLTSLLAPVKRLLLMRAVSVRTFAAII